MVEGCFCQGPWPFGPAYPGVCLHKAVTPMPRRPTRTSYNSRQNWPAYFLNEPFQIFSKKSENWGLGLSLASSSDSSQKITSVCVLRTWKDLLAVIFQVGRLILTRVVAQFLAWSEYWVAYSILAKFWFLAPKAPFELKNSGIDAEFDGESEKRAQKAPNF